MARSTLALALLCGLVCPALAAAPTDDRFRVTGELTPISISGDQRYSVQAQAKRAQADSSADGRFKLHHLNVPEGGCDPLPDTLFDDGFE